MSAGSLFSNQGDRDGGHEKKSDQAKVTQAKLSQDEIARKACAIHQQEGRQPGYAEQNWLEAEAQSQ